MRLAARFRFSLRTLLVVVTLTAIGTAVHVRQSRILQRLDHHRTQLAQCRETSASWMTVSFSIPEWAYLNNDARETYHAALVAQYEQALWRPWMTVDEPPEPEFALTPW